jgi:hypothetical protein
MMRTVEPIRDALFVAHMVRFGGMQLVTRPGRFTVGVTSTVPLTWWGRLFTWSPWPQPDDLLRLGPGDCVRVRQTFYCGTTFRARVGLYLNSLALEATERTRSAA